MCVYVYACVKGYMKGMVWIELDKREFMLHMEGQAWYVEGIMQWCSGGEPSFVPATT